MNLKIWVIVTSEHEPTVYSSLEAAGDFAIELLQDHAKLWGYDEDELNEAISKIKEGVESGSFCVGTYLGELEIDIYEREIELKEN